MFSNDLLGLPYNRVSTREQKDKSESLDDQLQHTLEVMRRYNIKLAYEPIQEDTSGYNLDRRGLGKLRQLIYDRKINAVIINESSRLSREIKHGIELLDEMWDYGIRLFIYYPHYREMNLDPDGADREILLNEMVFNRKWGVMLKKVMEWGKTGKIKRGELIPYSAPYGYEFIKEKHNTYISILPKHAEVVQSICEWYGAGMTVSQIISNVRGVQTPGEHRGFFRTRASGEWSVATIYYLLNNCYTYAGKMRQQYKGQENYIDIPSIISRELADKIKARLAVGSEKASRNRKWQYLMGEGRIRCKRCGYSIIGTSSTVDGRIYRYYACSSNTAPKARGKCGIKKVPAALVDNITWEFVKALINDPRGIANSKREEMGLIRKENAAVYKRLEQLDRTIKRNEAALQKAIEDRHRTQSSRILKMIEADIERIDVLLNDLETERRDLHNQLQDVITEEMIRGLEQWAENIRDEVQYLSYEDQKNILDMLDVTAHYNYEDGVPVIYLHFCLHTERFLLSTDSSRSSSPITNTEYRLTFRLVVEKPPPYQRGLPHH